MVMTCLVAADNYEQMKDAKLHTFAILAANETKIKSFGVRGLSLFGSSVRGEDTPTSDLDFIVEFETKSFDSYMDLKLFLEELFHRPVDLVLADGIKPNLRAAILREAIHAPGL
jgi:predicted nucleotidyltransferase